MRTLSLSPIAAATTISLNNIKNTIPLKPPHLTVVTQKSSFLGLRVSIGSFEVVKMKRCGGRGFGPVCYSGSGLLAPRNLQWISTISTAILMLVKGTAIQKSLLVPLFALQAPATIITWIKGDYGLWTAFLALLVRIFFYIPGELELPFVAILMVIVAPRQVLNLRGTQEGIILSLVVSGVLAFQHFSRAGSLRRALDQGSIIATLAIICVLGVACSLLV